MTYRLLTFTLALSVLPTSAQPIQYLVGTCTANQTSYKTISAAVAAVPKDSTIDICPGIYPEQISIDRPLTLHGIRAGNADSVVIAVPSAGLKSNFTSLVPDGCGTSCSLEGEAQIVAQNVDGPVNIFDIIVDGTGATFSNNAHILAGVVLDSTPGTVEHVELRDQYIAADHSASPTGYGIILADTSEKSPTVNVQGNHLYRFSNTGILSGVNLLASENTVDLRTISGHIGVFGIFQVGYSASIIGNIITGDGSPTISPNTFLAIGLQEPVATSTIEGNTIGNANLGIWTGGPQNAPAVPLHILHNRLMNNEIAIDVVTGEPTIRDNSIVGFTVAYGKSTGISLSCGDSRARVIGNHFFGTTIALVNVSSGLALSNYGDYHNVDQIAQTCP
jgi:hypothetical protein